MTDAPPIKDAVENFEAALDRFVRDCQIAGAYMPSLATRLRIHADELADRFPDEASQLTP